MSVIKRAAKEEPFIWTLELTALLLESTLQEDKNETIMLRPQIRKLIESIKITLRFCIRFCLKWSLNPRWYPSAPKCLQVLFAFLHEGVQGISAKTVYVGSVPEEVNGYSKSLMD